MENVIHGTSIGVGEDEPVLVARVKIDMAGENADGETEHDQAEKEREEVERLKELWLSLLEREQRLELRLMELDGLQEQEATVRELENRVSVAAVEARLLELKVSSLQEENHALEAQVSELDAVRAKLARAKEKLRALKARVQGEQEEARRETTALRERVTELERDGEERSRVLAAEAEAEAEALRKANAGLEEENMELALRLQDAEQVASSVHQVLEEDSVEEANYLRETNERLTRQIEQLHSDHCAHVEELVYLKWVNACLRYELRNHEHHPSSDEQDHDASGMSAMDLSKSMSYRSSEKAKQLMLQYGNLGLDGFDPALFSPLHESLYGDGDGNDYDDEQKCERKDEQKRSPGMSATMAAATEPTKRARPSKLKFLKNIKKLLASSRRGDRHGSGRGDRESKKAPIDEHLEKAMRWLSSHGALDGDNSYESTPLSSCERTPLSSVTTVDSHALARGREAAEAAASRLEAEMTRSKSDVGASYGLEVSRYHALRPDHPAGVGPDGFHSPEKRELRRHSEELRSPDAVYVRTRDVHHAE